MDRVFAMGRTYGGERSYENGVFRGKRALLSVTTCESLHKAGAHLSRTVRGFQDRLSEHV